MAIAWQKDTWTLVSAFSMWQCQFRVLGAVMQDMEGQKWLVFSCHLHDDPSLQKVMWIRILKLRNLFPELPVVTLCDHNSILGCHLSGAACLFSSTYCVALGLAPYNLACI